MVFSPDSPDSIRESIQARLEGRITKLTNFVQSSFNRLFLDSFSEVLYEYEVQLLAAQLSGWVDYAGGPITEDDLVALGITEFDDLDLLNEYMLDEHLDNIGSLVGTIRNDGEPATGAVRIEVFDSDTRVPDGLEVSTPPNFDGESQIFEVDLGGDSFVTPDDQGNTDFVIVDVVATEVGSETNVGSGRITQFRSPPPGVESVTNPTSTSGGEDPETNDEYRDRIKNAVFETSGGGTTEGIRGFIIGNVEGVNDVFVDEFFDATPVFVDVIVDGGVEQEVLDAIEESRPAGIRHNLERPTTYGLAVDIELRGSGIDQQAVRAEIEDYIFELDLGDDFIKNRITQRVLNLDEDIENILATNVRVVEVLNYKEQYVAGTTTYTLPEEPIGNIDDEKHFFIDEQSVYGLNVTPVDTSSVSVEAFVNGTQQSIADTEYDVIDNDGDGQFDSIDWSAGSVTPDDETAFTVSYDPKTSSSETFTYDGSTQFALTDTPALAADSSVSDASGDTYTLGTDYDIVDTTGDGVKDSLEWLGNSTPDSNEDFTVSYEIDVGSIRSVTGTLNGTEETEFAEGTDFNELDDNGDTYIDSIDWSVGGDVPDDGTDFSLDMSAQSDVVDDYRVSDREKISPLVDEIEVTVYE